MLDDKGVRRRFRASNYQSTTRVKPFICTMPMRLDEGWNQIQVAQVAVLILLLCLVHILYIIVAYEYLFLMCKTQLHLYKSTNSVTSTCKH